MKTAMQELIDELYRVDNNGGFFPIFRSDVDVKEYIEEALKKEKEQMIEFGYKCRNKCKKESKLLPQDIFNTTYNQNK